MDWEDVKTFAEVARDGTVRSAAKALGVHHSTISRRVERLEKALSVRLFDRRPEGYALTEAGEHLVGAANDVEDIFTAAQRKIAGTDDAPCGKVRITMAEPIAVHSFAPALPEFFQQYPELDLEIRVSYELLNLSRGDAEIAVRMDNNPPESLVGKRLFPYYETAFASPNTSPGCAILPPAPKRAGSVGAKATPPIASGSSTLSLRTRRSGEPTPTCRCRSPRRRRGLALRFCRASSAGCIQT